MPDPQRARRIREAAGVSQHRLAAELNVTRATVARWESGDRTPRGSNLVAYEKILRRLAALDTAGAHEIDAAA